MIYRILQKLNNFSIKFTLFIIFLAVVINVIFNMYLVKSKYYTEIRYFNIILFIILVLTLVNFSFTWFSSYQITAKNMNQGIKGIEGISGDKGEDAICDLDCGTDVAYATILKEINKHLNFLLKKQINYLEMLKNEETYAGYIEFKNNKQSFNIGYRDNYLNSEITPNGKISRVVVNNDYEISFITKDNTKITLKRGNYDKMALSRLDIEEDDIINGLIRGISVDTIIKNDFFLNKINIICHSNNYEKILRRTGTFETTEYKLIKYLSSIIKDWITDIVNFQIEVANERLYPGIRFLLKDNFTINMFDNYRDSKGDPINNPFNHFRKDIDGEMVIVDGPIKKYDIWRWDEPYSNTSLVIQKCFKKDNLPEGDQPKLSMIKTNSYEPLYTSRMNHDIYDTIMCPFNQMGIDGTNPDNLQFCNYLDNNTELKYTKKEVPVWKRKQCIPFAQRLSIYHPRFINGKYYFSDPITNRKYYPVGSVWSGSESVQSPETKTIFPTVGSSCSKDYMFGPQKETILVSGDVKLPIGYDLIWNSDDLVNGYKTKEVTNIGAKIFSNENGEGDSFDLPVGNYTRETLPMVSFNPKSLVVNDFYYVEATVSVNNINKSDHKYKSSTTSNISYTESTNIPPMFQFGLEPTSPKNDKNLNTYNSSYSDMITHDSDIKSYIIYSEQPSGNTNYYNALSFDSGLYFDSNVYEQFNKGNGASAYFSNINLNQQELLQGFYQSSGISDKNEYFGCVLFHDGAFARGNFKDLIKDKRALWVSEGTYDKKYLDSQGYGGWQKIKSFIILPGFEVTFTSSDNNDAPMTKGSGFYPLPKTFTYNEVNTIKLEVKRVSNTITFQPNQCWTFIKTSNNSKNEYYIHSAWVPACLCINPDGLLDTTTLNSRLDSNFTPNKYIGIQKKGNLGTKFIVKILPNEKYIIQSADYPGYYLWSDNGNFGVINLGSFWNNIVNLKISYFEPINITIENILNNTYCKDDGPNTFISCSTHKSKLNETNNIIIDYNVEKKCIHFKGQQSNLYATMSNNIMKFISETKNNLNCQFYLFGLNSEIDNTEGLFNSISKLNKPISLSIKYKQNNNYISLGVSNTDTITNIDNFIFKIMNMGTSEDLQPGPYNSISIFRPIPPPGYVSLGDIAVKNQNMNSLPPEVVKLAKGQLMYEINNGMGPPVVCVPESCTRELQINNQLAWNNNQGGELELFNNYSEYKNQTPYKTVTQKPCYLWANGLTDALTENKNRPLQNFKNTQGGYNLIRCTTTNSAPTSVNSKCYTLDDSKEGSCLRTIAPHPTFNYSKELSLYGNRPSYMKDSGYFPSYTNAYAISNTPLEYSQQKKSYYVEYVKDAPPNKYQLEGEKFDSNVKGNNLYYINTENDSDKKNPNFTNCLLLDCKNDKCDIKKSKCNYNDTRMLWRIKSDDSPDDMMSFNPISTKSEDQNINFMSHSNDNKCLKQYYNPEGVNKLIVENCNWDDLNWKYKSLDINKL